MTCVMRVFSLAIVLAITYAQTDLPSTDEPPVVRCPRDLLCETPCYEGRVMDANGCETCQCRNAVTVTAMEEVSHHDGSFSREPMRPVTDTPPCRAVMCFMECQHGFMKDDNGCDMCRCNEDPCSVMQCSDAEICTPCTKDSCAQPATCKPKSLCHHMVDMHNAMSAMMVGGEPMMGGMMGGGDDMMMDSEEMRPGMMMPLPYMPMCEDDSGLFRPRQCHEESAQCWCVNDRGEELEATRHDMMDDQWNCDHNLTQSAHVSFMMMHDLDLENSQQILNELASTVQSQVQKWMMLGQQYLNDFKVNLDRDMGNTLQVQFVVARGGDPMEMMGPFMDEQMMGDGPMMGEGQMMDGMMGDMPAPVFNIGSEEAEDQQEATDLATALYSLSSEIKKPGCKVAYDGHELQPIDDSYYVEHSYMMEEPRLPSNGGLRAAPEDDDGLVYTDDETAQITLYYRGRNFCHRHPRLAIASLATGTIMIVCLILILAMTLKKKKAMYAKKNHYKQNLAFANKCYDIGKPIGGDGDVVLEKEITCYMTEEKPSIA